MRRRMPPPRSSGGCGETGPGRMKQVEITVPGDKSLSPRALIFSALAERASRVRGGVRTHAVESTADVLLRLGVDVPALDGAIAVRGVGLRGFHSPSRDLDCGNTGTTTRLIPGFLAALPFSSRLVGDASL